MNNVEKYLRYEPDTGNFYWIADSNSRGPSKIGQQAGCLNTLGYWQIGLFRQRLSGHRLAWLLTYGYMPDYIDHKNGDPSDNRLCNLREATQSQNLGNRNDYVRGIEAHGAKFRARIGVRGTRIELGSFNSKEEALAAYHVASDKYFGEFATVNRE